MPDPQQVTIADVMRAYAADAVEMAKRQGIELDYSEASLEHIDRMLYDRTQGRVIDPQTLTVQEQDDLWLYCKTIGGYVGEVVLRNLGGSWHARESDTGELSIKLMAADTIEGWPPDSVWRTLTEPFRSMVTYYRTLRTVLGHGEERTEDGFKVVKLPPLSNRPPGSANG